MTQENLFDDIEFILDAGRASAKNMRLFDGFVPLTDGINSDGGGIIFTDVTPSLLDSPVSIKALVPSQGAGYVNAIVCLSKLTHEQYRKKTGMFDLSPYALSLARVLNKDNFCEECYLSIPKNSTSPKVLVGANYTIDTAKKSEVIAQAKLLLGLQFYMENICSVYLKSRNDPIGFTLPLESLDMAKGVFKLRDVPDGKQRRAALRHIVNDHKRRLPNRDETQEIAKYWRGARQFDWLGLSGRINIPKYMEVKACE
jgi:hypothetical protein